MSNLLGIATSGLLSLQQALNTTGHNITNVNTDGFSRQLTELETRPAASLGGEYFGSGVKVDAIRRAYDGFVVGELRTRNSALGLAQTMDSMSAELDILVGDSANGLAPAMQRFFEAVQGVSRNPSAPPERQVLLSDAEILADRFNQVDAALLNFEDAANSRLESAVAEINAISENIALINNDIVLASAGTASANDLLDQRDQLVLELSEKIGIIALTQPDNSINITVGSGQSLVVGGQSGRLTTQASTVYPGRLEVAVEDGTATSPVISHLINSGEVGGVLEFRSRVLEPARAELGRLAVGIGELVNTQHRLGFDLDGQLGGSFFAPHSATVLPSSTNAGASTMAVAVADVGALQASDYRADYDGSQWVITRTSDGSTVAGAGPFSIDGLTITIGGGAPATGDSYLVRPVVDAPGQFKLLLNNVNRVAAAAPVSGSATVANAGSAQIADVAVSSTTGLPLATPITLTFNPNAFGAGVPGYDVVGGPAGPLAFDPATESGGKSFNISGFGDLSFTLSGIPKAGDTLTLQSNVGGTGDNRNALQIADMQSARLLDNGRATFAESYSNLVADVGVRTRQAQASFDAEQGLFRRAEASREQISGVNLEEEAANLLRLQQAYQAAAQVVSVVDTVFQTLINATGR